MGLKIMKRHILIRVELVEIDCDRNLAKVKALQSIDGSALFVSVDDIESFGDPNFNQLIFNGVPENPAGNSAA